VSRPPAILDRYDVFPHVEDRLSMTIREWLVFHLTMHRHYTRYRGRRVLKTPFDWIVLGDIVQDTRPELIVEVGAFEGGAALWMADLLDAIDVPGHIIGIDVKPTPTAVSHPRIDWVIGDCLEDRVLDEVARIADGRRGMVIEDSDHKYHVTKGILERYERFVAPGCYFLVEDTIVDFIDVPPFPGPLRAAQEFVADRGDAFVVDRSREKYVITHNPMGYLLRIA
jgi:cephalosporin hydroxylase